LAKRNSKLTYIETLSRKALFGVVLKLKTLEKYKKITGKPWLYKKELA